LSRHLMGTACQRRQDVDALGMVVSIRQAGGIERMF